MDLSGIIFVVLAIGWAVYLLPKALKHHDDIDRTRPVEEFSDSVRVLGRGAALRARAVVTGTALEDAEPAAEPAVPAPARPTLTREAARTAARRRRRVLGLLLTVLVALAVTSYLACTPWYSTAVPGALVVAFLVAARLTVRAQQRVRPPARVQHVVEEAAPARATAPVPAPAVGGEADLGDEDTQGLSRDELAAAVASPVLDDEAGLWDPLPVTLPTYVTKPRAQRTVRTIELTGMTSSGHDPADTALAQEAAAAEAEAPAVEAEEQRKAAGA